MRQQTVLLQKQQQHTMYLNKYMNNTNKIGVNTCSYVLVVHDLCHHFDKF